jgi:large subunit ribosomal protein L9
MEIILKQDINNLGYKNEIVNVKDGYARNYLIPNKMAILATERNRKMLAEEIRQQAHKEEKIKNEALDKAKVLEGLKLTIGAKAAASTGKIFGSVNTIQIANAIKEACNIEVDRKQIVMNEDAVKELGNYKAKIKLHKDVQAEVEFEVVAE